MVPMVRTRNDMLDDMKDRIWEVDSMLRGGTCSLSMLHSAYAYGSVKALFVVLRPKRPRGPKLAFRP